MSLLPTAAPAGTEVIGEDDIRFQRGPRSYRVRRLARNLSAESRKVTLCLSAGEHMDLDTLDLYQARTRARAAFVKAAALELGVSEPTIAADLSALVLAWSRCKRPRSAPTAEGRSGRAAADRMHEFSFASRTNHGEHKLAGPEELAQKEKRNGPTHNRYVFLPSSRDIYTGNHFLTSLR